MFERYTVFKQTGGDPFRKRRRRPAARNGREESGLEAGSDGCTVATNGATEVLECCLRRDSQKPLGARR
jgi:hypothetical protein